MLRVWWLSLYQICFKYVLYSQRTQHFCSRCSFDDVSSINFRFRLLVTWSSPNGRAAASHQISANNSIQYGDRSKQVLELCAKFGSHISYGPRERRSFVPHVRLMTSGELTSGFDFFGSCGYLRSSFNQIRCRYLQPLRRYYIYEMQDGRCPPSWIYWEGAWNHSRRPIHVG